MSKSPGRFASQRLSVSMCGDNLPHHGKNLLTYRLRVAACRGEAGISCFRNGLPEVFAFFQTNGHPAGNAGEKLRSPEIDRADRVVDHHTVDVMDLPVNVRVAG